ncbi:hypothetical protein SSX86_028004 [Deinandra increscens subsp. villosa]|uniref:Ferredoxin thioredoxin reductase alpha chain domain-containing protein n=1 Tax=Deinandra increscens subsp. villosa TaxID=3103831 RepID=A0AAP0CC85_9ASTR
MTHPAILAAATPITLPPSAVKTPVITIPPFLLTVTTSRRSNPLPWIKAPAAAVSDSAATMGISPLASTPEDEEIPAKIGARVRVKVPLKVYHIPKVLELDLNGKEGEIKEYVAVWKGKHISANLHYKIEFLEVLEGRGDSAVKFFAHLSDDEFDYLD